MNSTAPTPKLAVALELLERAIELYLRGDSYYSSLHLGGAAEEVLAIYIRDLSDELPATAKPASDHLKDAFLAFKAPSSPRERVAAEKWIHDRMFEAKNTVKHKRGKRDLTVSFDAKEEAFDVVDLAVSNYFVLFSHMQLPWMPCVEQFDQARRREYRADEA
ncbi:hypothetical protein [Arenimonas oryziterrae]|uniref:HEPN domain-containing protein n=1 Tax=Arenimonas oryziterrae DSM 21050 = YC6267 TaxID=1121015 RepID=A0A091AQW7_9GAMM|nr:hypothetical protein [Arenimonas oryziterrae]KFN41771.1 hypothetical protein N789_14770 [Arenimonas oryziterrae DSM 21050 = YC6267]